MEQADRDDWLQRWREGRIGFHSASVHPELIRYADRLPHGARVLVPLCGKSVDMRWLQQRGHAVVGIELSVLAARAFFDEQQLTAEVTRGGAFERHAVPGLEILVGDFFDASAAEVGEPTAAWDRAALVALPASLRPAYARKMAQLLPAGARLLLACFEYPQELIEGPPFSVSAAEVSRLYGDAFEVEALGRKSIDFGNPRFTEAGVSAVEETVFVLTRR